MYISPNIFFSNYLKPLCFSFSLLIDSSVSEILLLNQLWPLTTDHASSLCLSLSWTTSLSCIGYRLSPASLAHSPVMAEVLLGFDGPMAAPSQAWLGPGYQPDTGHFPFARLFWVEHPAQHVDVTPCIPSQVCVSFRHVHGASLSCEPHTCLPYLRCCPSSWHFNFCPRRPQWSQLWDLTWPNTFCVGTSPAPLPPLLGVCPAGLLCTSRDACPSPCAGSWVMVLLDYPVSFPAHVALWLTDACSCPLLLTFSHISPNLNSLCTGHSGTFRRPMWASSQ